MHKKCITQSSSASCWQPRLYLSMSFRLCSSLRMVRALSDRVKIGQNMSHTILGNSTREKKIFMNRAHSTLISHSISSLPMRNTEFGQVWTDGLILYLYYYNGATYPLFVIWNIVFNSRLLVSSSNCIQSPPLLHSRLFLRSLQIIDSRLLGGSCLFARSILPNCAFALVTVSSAPTDLARSSRLQYGFKTSFENPVILNFPSN